MRPASNAAKKWPTEKAAWEEELGGWTHERDDYSMDMIDAQAKEAGNWLHPRQVLRELENAMPEDKMVSTDIGNINSIAHSYLRFDRPRSFFAPMSFGNCGYALPTVIGAKARRAGTPCHRLCRRRCLGHEHGRIADLCASRYSSDRRSLPQPPMGRRKEKSGRFLRPSLSSPDELNQKGNERFADMARAMGAEGVVVDQLDDVGAALTKAVDAQMNDGKTTVLEVMCTRELGDPFRRDALSKPVRHLDKYKNFV